MTTLELILTVVAIIGGINALGLGWLGYVYWTERPSRRECDAARYRVMEVSP